MSHAIRMEFNDRIVRLSDNYLQQGLQFMPTPAEFVGWVDTFPPAVRPRLYAQGPEASWHSQAYSLLDYVLTSRGYSVEAYLLQHLGEAEYLRWVSLYATSTLARPC